MRPPRAITKARNRGRRQLRWELVHAATCTHPGCVVYQVMRENLEEPDDYFKGSSRPVKVPRSLRRIHGNMIYASPKRP